MKELTTIHKVLLDTLIANRNKQKHVYLTDFDLLKKLKEQLKEKKLEAISVQTLRRYLKDLEDVNIIRRVTKREETPKGWRAIRTILIN